MGRRELLIAAAFVIAAALVYQITATPAPNGQSFSFSQLWNHIRRNMNDRPPATATHNESAPVPAGVTEVRVSGMTGGVTLTGESREDVSAQFTIRSTGADDEASAACVKTAKLQFETHGDTLVVSPNVSRECRNVGAITLSLPKRLAARVEGGGSIRASQLAAIKIMGASGAVVLTDIAGAVTGDQRTGNAQITRVGSLDLTLANTQTTIESVRGAARLTLSNGRCHLADIAGSVDIDERMADIETSGATGPLKVGGTGGHLRLNGASTEIRVDTRRADVLATVSKASPLNVSTTDGRIDVRLTDGLPIDLDAVATDGDVVASDWKLTPSHVDREARLAHTWGKVAMMTLRSTHGDITITKIGR